MKKLIHLTVFLTFLISSLSAQNYFFEEGQTGFTLSGLYAFTINQGVFSSAYGLSSAYTVNGKLTFGLALSILQPNAASVKGLTPHASYIILKKTSDRGILNIGLSGAYSFQFYEDIRMNVSTIGPILYYQFELDQKIKLSIGGTYSFGENRVTQSAKNLKNFVFPEGNIDDVSEVFYKINQNSYGFSANLLLNKFYIEPSVSISSKENKTNSLYGVSIGYVF